MIVSAATVVFLLLGYLASQVAAMQGTFASYAEKADSAPIRTLALLIFVGAIISCFIPDREPNS
jgi:hypothetical protein